MAEFRKKPVVVEAMQVPSPNDLDDFIEFTGWIGDKVKYAPIAKGLPGLYAHIETPEGTMSARIGDWIIKGAKGEFYPCKPDIFEATYEPVEPTE